jgi:hypothetical protein
MLSNTINQKIAEALKAKDEVLLSTLRLLSSAFNYERIAKQHNLSDEEEIVVIRREAKKRTDAIESLKEAQGKTSTSDTETLDKRLKQEEKELTILKEFLPQELSAEELIKLVDDAISETGASNIGDLGKVIGVVIAKAKGAAEGSKVAQLVKSKLGLDD